MKEASTHGILYGSESGIGTSATHDSANGLCDRGRSRSRRNYGDEQSSRQPSP